MRAFSEELAPLRQRRSAHDPGRVLVDLAVMLADGGDAISDLAVLRDGPKLFGSVASTAIAWRVLDAVDHRGVAALRQACAVARDRLWSGRPLSAEICDRFHLGEGAMPEAHFSWPRIAPAGNSALCTLA